MAEMTHTEGTHRGSENLRNAPLMSREDFLKWLGGFVSHYGRLPRPTGNPSEAYLANRMYKEDRAVVNDILGRYGVSLKAGRTTSDALDRLEAFMKVNGRFPDSVKDRTLYAFAMRLFNSDSDRESTARSRERLLDIVAKYDLVNSCPFFADKAAVKEPEADVDMWDSKSPAARPERFEGVYFSKEDKERMELRKRQDTVRDGTRMSRIDREVDAVADKAYVGRAELRKAAELLMGAKDARKDWKAAFFFPMEREDMPPRWKKMFDDLIWTGKYARFAAHCFTLDEARSYSSLVLDKGKVEHLRDIGRDADILLDAKRFPNLRSVVGNVYVDGTSPGDFLPLEKVTGDLHVESTCRFSRLFSVAGDLFVRGKGVDFPELRRVDGHLVDMEGSSFAALRRVGKTLKYGTSTEFGADALTVKGAVRHPAGGASDAHTKDVVRRCEAAKRLEAFGKADAVSMGIGKGR